MAGIQLSKADMGILLFGWAELLGLLEFASEVPMSSGNLWLSHRQDHHHLFSCSEK